MSISKIIRSHVVLSLLVPFTFGIAFEMFLPGVMSIPMLTLTAILFVALSLLIKITDAKYKFYRYTYIGVGTLMFSLGVLCLNIERVNKIKDMCDNSDKEAVLIAHISSEFKRSAYNTSCYADVYCLEDSLMTITDEKRVRCQLNIQCNADSLTTGDIIMIPKKAVSTANKNDFAQFVYDRFLNLQGVQAVCDVDTFAYVSHSSASKLRDRAYFVNGYFKNTLKKTKL